MAGYIYFEYAGGSGDYAAKHIETPLIDTAPATGAILSIGRVVGPVVEGVSPDPIGFGFGIGTGHTSGWLKLVKNAMNGLFDLTKYGTALFAATWTAIGNWSSDAVIGYENVLSGDDFTIYFRAYEDHGTIGSQYKAHIKFNLSVYNPVDGYRALGYVTKNINGYTSMQSFSVTVNISGTVKSTDYLLCQLSGGFFTTTPD